MFCILRCSPFERPIRCQMSLGKWIPGPDLCKSFSIESLLISETEIPCHSRSAISIDSCCIKGHLTCHDKLQRFGLLVCFSQEVGQCSWIIAFLQDRVKLSTSNVLLNLFQRGGLPNGRGWG